MQANPAKQGFPKDTLGQKPRIMTQNMGPRKTGQNPKGGGKLTPNLLLKKPFGTGLHSGPFGAKFGVIEAGLISSLEETPNFEQR